MMSMFPCLNLSLAKTTTACLPREAQEKKIRLRCFYALDVRTEFAQFFIEMLVAAVDVIDAAHFGDSICFQPCEHQRSRRAQIARHYRRPEKAINTVNYCSSTFQ